MPTLNEVKYTTLAGSGHINGDESAYWVGLGATPGRHLMEQMMEVFLANGATSTQFNEAAMQFMFAQGYTAEHINERWYQYWLGGGMSAYTTTAKAIEGDWPNYERYYANQFWTGGNSTYFSFAAFLRVPTQTYDIQNKPLLIGMNNAFNMFLRDWHASGANQNRFLFYLDNSLAAGWEGFTLGNATHGIEKGDWFALMVSIDYSGATPVKRFYTHKVGDVAAIDISGGTELTSDAGPVTYDFDDATVVAALGAHPSWSTNYGNFDACEVFIDNTYVDWSDAATRAKFVDSAGKPVGLGATGADLTGSQPKIYAPDGDLSSNLGSAGNYTAWGTISDASTSPTD